MITKSYRFLISSLLPPKIFPKFILLSYTRHPSVSYTGYMFSMKHASGGSESLALFDIGASSIGVGLAVRTKDATELLWYSRTEYAFERGTDFVRYQKSMYATLLEAGMSMVSDGFRVAKCHPAFSAHALTVRCVLASPWFFGTVREHTTTKTAPFEITHSLSDQVHATMFSTFLEMPSCVSWKEIMGDSEMLEQYDLKVLLDGYPVQTPERKIAHEVTFRTYLALVSQSVAEHVQDILHRIIPNHTVSRTSSTRLFSESIGVAGSPVSPQEDIVLVEVGGQLSSVSLFRDASLVGTGTLPFGVNDLLLSLAPDATTKKDALDAYSLHEKQQQAGGESPRASAYEAAGMQWHDAVIQEIINLSAGITIPKKALLVSSELYEQFSLFLSIPSVVPAIREEQAFTVVPYARSSNPNPQGPLGTKTDERLHFLCTHC